MKYSGFYRFMLIIGPPALILSRMFIAENIILTNYISDLCNNCVIYSYGVCVSCNFTVLKFLVEDIDSEENEYKEFVKYYVTKYRVFDTEA